MNKILLRIADLRKKAKVTQQELADSIGVSFHDGVIIGLN
ncbi:MAG: helix-turn-helix transcriptional regulator [Lachnospiraceae bacterium]